MKIFIKDNLEIVIDQIAYITTTIEPTSYTLVMVDGKSYNLTESEYTEIKATSITTGTSGIPSGWTVENY